MTEIKKEHELVAGFNNDPNIFIEYMSNVPPLVMMCLENKETGKLSINAFLPTPHNGEIPGNIFGGFDVTGEEFTENEAKEVMDIIQSDKVTDNFIEITSEGTKRKVPLRKIFTLVTMLPEEPKYSIEKATWVVKVDTIINIGDFKSDDHLRLTAGTYSLFFQDELHAKTFYKDINDHYNDCYKIVNSAISKPLKEKKDGLA